MTEKSIERSKMGRLLAKTIKFYHSDPHPWPADTIDLVTWVEPIVDWIVDYASKLKNDSMKESQHVFHVAQGGDRGELVEYLRNDKNPITPDIRALLIECLSGKKRGRAHRPKALATDHRKRRITAFVVCRMYAGASYMGAVNDARAEFKCSDKTVLNACEEYGEWVSWFFRIVVHLLKIQPVISEILRRGEPEHCERTQELVGRLQAVSEDLSQIISDDELKELPRSIEDFISFLAPAENK